MPPDWEARAVVPTASAAWEDWVTANVWEPKASPAPLARLENPIRPAPAESSRLGWLVTTCDVELAVPLDTRELAAASCRTLNWIVPAGVPAFAVALTTVGS